MFLSGTIVSHSEDRRMQDFLDGTRQPIVLVIIHENGMKLKKIGLKGDVHP